MKSMIKYTLFSVLIILTVPLLAFAEAPSIEGVVDQRESNQEKRIKQGEKSGQLTKREEKNLEREQKKIKKMEDRAMQDGKMDKKEVRHIEHAQNKASQDIYKKKHNKRRH